MLQGESKTTKGGKPDSTRYTGILIGANQSRGGSSDRSQGAGEVSSRGSSGRGSSGGDSGRRLRKPRAPLTFLSRRLPPAARSTRPAQQPPAPPLRPLPLRGRSANRAGAHRGICLSPGWNTAAIFSDLPGRLVLPRALWLAPRLGAGLTLGVDARVRGQGKGSAPAHFHLPHSLDPLAERCSAWHLEDANKCVDDILSSREAFSKSRRSVRPDIELQKCKSG